MMPEGRLIFRRISESKRWSGLKTDTARMLYMLILIWDDVEGRITAEPSLLKSKVAPMVEELTKEVIAESLRGLDAAGLIGLYVARGEKFMVLAKRLQKNDPSKEAKSTIPPPPREVLERLKKFEETGTEGEHSAQAAEPPKGKPKRPRKPQPQAQVDIDLVELLIQGITSNNPNARVIKTLTENRKADWVNSCRLLRESDGQDAELIKAVIIWCQKDSFWRTNILSMPTLREKWDKLVGQMGRPTGEEKNRPSDHAMEKIRKREMDLMARHKPAYDKFKKECEAAGKEPPMFMEFVRQKEREEKGGRP